MKTRDIQPGVAYAVIAREHGFANKVVFETTELHVDPRSRLTHRSFEDAVRPKQVTDKDPGGLLGRTADGRDEGQLVLVRPAHVKMTWEEYEAEKARAKESRERYAREQAEKREAALAEVAELVEAFEVHASIRIPERERRGRIEYGTVKDEWPLSTQTVRLILERFRELGALPETEG